MQPETSIQPPASTRKQILVEMAVVYSLLWIPVMYGGIQSIFVASSSSTTISSEVYRLSRYVVQAALPVFLFWRAGEPLSKLGIRVPRPSDLWITILLMGFCLLFMWVGGWYTLLFAHMPGAFTRHKVGHILPNWFELIVFLGVGLFEETLQRGYLCARLRDLNVSVPATLAISALMFAFPHVYQGWAVLPIHFVFGVGFAAVFLRFRTLWPLIIAHGLYDFFLLLGSRHLHR